MTDAQPEASRPAQIELCTWRVPGNGGAACEIVGRAGEVTTIVGANGAGKSALGLWMHLHSGVPNTRRLIAHRKLWFEHAGPGISPVQREQVGTNMESWGREANSRYLDHADAQRASIVLFDLLAMVNAQNARAVALYRSGVTPEEKDLWGRLNAILADAGLTIQLELTDKQTINAVRASPSARYPISQMSDGEKSAVLLAAEVLVAPSGSVQIIDEPERHLHRSISASLVAAVLADRPDCHFVVLTHDLELAASLGTSRGSSYSLTGVRWVDGSATDWDLFPVDPDAGLPEDARRAILGGRRDLLFIEGERGSLDLRLYRILFPGWTLFPAGGAEQVMRAVTGLRSSDSHHWIRAHGIVDGDGRDDEERLALTTRGILPLPVSEVESLYYLGSVIKAVATIQAKAIEKLPADLIEDANRRALEALHSKGTSERLAAKLALAELRRRVIAQLPTEMRPDADTIRVELRSPYLPALNRIKALHYARDLDGLTRLLPIRDTAMPAQVATALGFRSVSDYEAAVRVRVREDAELLNELRSLVGPVPVGAE